MPPVSFDCGNSDAGQASGADCSVTLGLVTGQRVSVIRSTSFHVPATPKVDDEEADEQYFEEESSQQHEEFTGSGGAGKHVDAQENDARKKKRVSKAYTPEQKIAYVDLFREEQASKGFLLSQRQFAQQNRLSHARFSAWCKDYDRLKSLDPIKQKTTRLRKPAARYPTLEARVNTWLDDFRKTHLNDPCTKIIQAQARVFASELGIPDFVASSTWLGRFRKRSESNKHLESQTSDKARNESVIRRSMSVGNSFSTNEDDDSPCKPPVWTTTYQESLVHIILKDFLERGNAVSQVEMAGIGLSPLPERGRKDTGYSDAGDDYIPNERSVIVKPTANLHIQEAIVKPVTSDYHFPPV